MLRCRYSKSRNPNYQASLCGSTENTISLGERAFWLLCSQLMVKCSAFSCRTRNIRERPGAATLKTDPK